MIRVRPSADRMHSNFGWLDSRHTFSFGDHHDPEQMGFRALRVINEDRVTPGDGFGMHQHRDMEILSYVLDGALEHKDSMGTGSIIRPGDIQRMSAGTGVYHSENNASKSESVHFLQIWLLPSARGIAPSYEQKAFPAADLTGRLRRVAARNMPGSPAHDDGAISIHADAALYAGLLLPGDEASLELTHGRHAWVQVARGSVEMDARVLLSEGDGAAISDVGRVRLRGVEPAEVLVFDLA